MKSYKTNVLTWEMFMASSMKFAIHLGPDFLKNSEFYKNTRFEKIENVFNNTSHKSIEEHSEEIVNVRSLEYSRHHHGRDQHWSTMRRSKCDEGKSFCLRRFSSMCWSDGTRSRSRRKMERPNWRSQEVFLVPRRSGTRRRSNWIRVEKFPRIFDIVYSSRNPERLGGEEHPTRELQGPDHLHVNVQWDSVEISWSKLHLERQDRDFSWSRVWTVGPYRQQNGTVIQRNRSSYLHNYQCFESWNLEAEKRWKCEQYTHKNSMCRCAQCVTTHTGQVDHISTREHAWLEGWKAEDCTSLCPKTLVIHVSCLFLCRTWHWPQAQVLSHLPHPSFRQSHQHIQDLWCTIHIYPAKFHGRAADQHKSHLS